MMVLIAVATEDDPRLDNKDALRCAAAVSQVLSARGIPNEILLISPSDLAAPQTLVSRIRAARADCVFNLFEGFSFDSEAEIRFAALLEKSELAFTGNCSQALSLCLDKDRNKDLLRKAGVIVPNGFLLRSFGELEALRMNFPVFLKPVCEDASVGIDESSFCRNKTQLRSALQKKLAQFPGGVLLEDFIDGDEYNVSCLGHEPYELLAISRLEYSRYPGSLPFLSYDSKWNECSDDFRKLVPIVQTGMPAVLQDKISRQCRLAGRTLGCHGYFRVDLREKAGEMYVLDVNPNPDINVDSGFIRQAAAAGYNYADVILKILKEVVHGYTV